MVKENQKDQIRLDPDYIPLKRYKYSLSRLLERYPEGCPEHIAAEALGLSEEEFNEEYEKIVACLRAKMGV